MGRGSLIVLVLVLDKSTHFWQQHEQKTIDTFSFSSTLDL